jgi:hypothetical protein
MSQSRVLLVLLVVIYAVIGALFALRTPAWQAPDEPAHYNYVAQVAVNGCCPLLELGDWDSPYLETLKSARFAPHLLDQLPAVQYEDHQPPMYYLLASLAFKLTNGSLVALRLFSVLIGAGVVLGAYAVGKALLPTQPQIALGAAAIVAFVPQHVAMLAAVNNDGLAELVVALALWLTIRYLKTQDVKTWQLGVLVGIGLLTKLSTIFLIGLIPFAILLKWWLQRREKPFPLRALVAFALPVLILGGIWWARNISIYGFPDVFGLGRHNLVVADQARTTDEIARVGFSQYLTNSLELTFNSFWGQFGWMAFPLQSWIYALISVFLLLAAVGWLLGFRYRLPAEPNRMAQRAAWLVLCLTALAAVAQYIYYNLEFLQLQGRYMYPGLISFGIGLALGFDGWRRLLRVEHGLRIYAGVAVILLLIPLDLYLIWRVIPGLAP